MASVAAAGITGTWEASMKQRKRRKAQRSAPFLVPAPEQVPPIPFLSDSPSVSCRNSGHDHGLANRRWNSICWLLGCFGTHTHSKAVGMGAINGVWMRLWRSLRRFPGRVQPSGLLPNSRRIVHPPELLLSTRKWAHSAAIHVGDMRCLLDRQLRQSIWFPVGSRTPRIPSPSPAPTRGYR